jgi:hypothetical protein
MKKIMYRSLTLLIFISCVYFGWDHFNQQTNVKREQAKQNYIQFPPKMEKEKKVIAKQNNRKYSPRKPAQDQKQPAENDKDKLALFQRKKLDWIKEDLFLVEGVVAVFKKDPLIEPLYSKGRIYFYESQFKEGPEVLYDSKNNRYGTYTKEVKLKGDLKTILSFAESKSFQVVYKNELLKTVILKIDNLEDTSELSYFLNNPEIQWNLGIVYTRPSPK